MAAHYSDREVLEIFIESVDEVLGSSFLKQARDGGISTSFYLTSTGYEVSRTGPDREALKALLLTVRFFCQDSEPTSVGNMGARFETLAVEATLKSRFRESRSNFNSFLDSAPSTGFPDCQTRRVVFEAFLYGIFAHANPAQRRKVKAWEGDEFFPDVEAEFDLILVQFLQALRVLAEICREAIKSGV